MVTWLTKSFIQFCLFAFTALVIIGKFVFSGLWYVTGVLKQRPLFVWLCFLILAELIGGYAESFVEYQILGNPIGFYGSVICFVFGIGHLIFEIVNWFRDRL